MEGNQSITEANVIKTYVKNSHFKIEILSQTTSSDFIKYSNKDIFFKALAINSHSACFVLNLKPTKTKDRVIWSHEGKTTKDTV